MSMHEVMLCGTGNSRISSGVNQPTALASSSAMAVSIFGVANVMQGSGGMLGNYGAGLLANYSGSFAGVYATIAGVGAVLIILTLKLPTEATAAVSAGLGVNHPTAS